jgi:hypothetical protein
MLLGGGTAAFATITTGPVSDGVIHGCYKTAATNGSHSLVLQNTGTHCPSGDTAIKWNERGPAGPQGPQGPKGATGPAGASGTGATVTSLPPGNANCPTGGASVTDGSGNTASACNGASGVNGETYVQEEYGISAGQTPPHLESETADCPSGDVATSGGYFLSRPMGIGGEATEQWIPTGDNATATNGVPTGWEVYLDETGTAGNPQLSYILNVYAYCAPGT